MAREIPPPAARPSKDMMGLLGIRHKPSVRVTVEFTVYGPYKAGSALFSCLTDSVETDDGARLAALRARAFLAGATHVDAGTQYDD